MTIQKLLPDNIEYFTLELEPKRTYQSSSFGNISGSINRFPRASIAEKDFESAGQIAFKHVLDNYPYKEGTDKLTQTDYEEWKKNAAHTLYILDTLKKNAGSEKSKEVYHVERFTPPVGRDLTDFPNVSGTKGGGFATTGPVFQDGKIVTPQRHRRAYARNVVKQLMTHYRVTNPSAHYAYTNYNCLNFFTGAHPHISDQAALIYPNSSSFINAHGNGTGDIDGSNNFVGDPNAFKVKKGKDPKQLSLDTHTAISGVYVTSGAFTFDFFINPKYDFTTAGTIFHLSSTYAISLATGSLRDNKGEAGGFRLLLQLTNSADISPDFAARKAEHAKQSTKLPENIKLKLDHTFISRDNCLKRNHWHHVAIRWGGKNIQAGSGSFIVDGVEQGTFNIFSSSIAPARFNALVVKHDDNVTKRLDPQVLTIGGYLAGPNAKIGSNDARHALLFGAEVADCEGVVSMSSDNATYQNQFSSLTSISNQLNAQVHDLKIFGSYLRDDEIERNRFKGIEIETKLNEKTGFASDTSNDPKKRSTVRFKNLLFYLPPFFTKKAPGRPFPRDVGDDSTFPANKSWMGGVFRTPFQLSKGTTIDPLNAEMSLSVNGHYINLENFTRDFATGLHPRLINLTASMHNIIETANGVAGQNFPVEHTYSGRHFAIIEVIQGLPKYNNGAQVGDRKLPYQIVDGTGNANLLSASQYLYTTSSTVRRNLTVLPCDNGQFTPNFDFLLYTRNVNSTFTGTGYLSGALNGQISVGQPWPKENKPASGSALDKYVNDLGNLDLSMISLNDTLNLLNPDKNKEDPGYSEKAYSLDDFSPAGTHVHMQNKDLPDGPKQFGLQNESELYGVSPEDMFTKSGIQLNAAGTPDVPTVFRRYQGDSSSLAVVFFSIPRVYYGKRILPGSFEVKDTNITGSNGYIDMTLKDDGSGNLYVANSLTPHATWASVGNIFYDEGIVVIKSPNIPMFGQEQFEMSFKGQQAIHTLNYYAFANVGQINSSSNPSFKRHESELAHTDESSVQITGMYLHDNNFNVIARANLAQPFFKKNNDKIMFKIKLDF